MIKFGLNIVYRPCQSVAYNPVHSPVTGLWYCGRRVMKNHNCPAVSTTNGRCGPTNWANCPACCTLKNSVVDGFVSKCRWQRWSGLVYCGRYFEAKEPQHDEYCDPNNGLPCPECSSILLLTKFEVSFHSEGREFFIIRDHEPLCVLNLKVHALLIVHTLTGRAPPSVLYVWLKSP